MFFSSFAFCSHQIWSRFGANFIQICARFEPVLVPKEKAKAVENKGLKVFVSVRLGGISYYILFIYYIYIYNKNR